MKIRKLLSAMTAAACVLSFAAGTGTPAVLSVSAADAPAASAVTTAATTYHTTARTTAATTSQHFDPVGTVYHTTMPTANAAGTVVTTSGPKEPAGTVMTQTTADLRNVPLQGKFNIKITIEDILGLTLPALDCELIRLDTNEVVASWNTGTEPNKVVENLDYSFKRLDVTLKGDIIYALRIKNMPDHMVFYDTKMPNPIRIAGISILEFANGTNIYGNVKLCDPNYTEPAHTEVTTGIPTAADMTATTNNTTYTTVTSTVMTHITTLPTTGTKLRFSLGQYEGQELKGDTVSLTVSEFSDRSIPVFGVRKGVTVQYALADPTIAEIVGSESQSVTLRARKAGNTTLTAKSSDGQTATIKVAVDTLDPNATDCSDAFMNFCFLGDIIVMNEGNTFGVPVAGFYENLVEKNGLQFTVEDESVAEVVKGDRRYFILRGLKPGKTKVTLEAGKGNACICYVEVLPEISSIATTDATYTHDTTYTHSTEDRTGKPLIIYGNGKMQLGDLYYFDVSGVTPESLLTYKFSKDIVEIVSQDENHLLLKGIKPGKTLMTAKIANGKETSMMINISEETAPAVTNVTADILLPKENTKVSTTVKTWCVSNDTQPVFDEQGHYRGTNALLSVKLETATEPKIGMQLSEDGKTVKSLDLTEIYVQMTEQRRFNIYGHNVSYQLKVLDYGYTQETDNTAQFYVKLGTNYKDGQYEGMEIQPLTLKFKLPGDITADVPNGESTVSYIETAPTDTNASPDVEGTGSTTETTYVSSSGTNQPPQTSTTKNTKAQKFDRGNVNCKEGTDVSDAVLLARFVAEDTDANITAEGKKNADVNGDGKLTSDDVIAILRIIAKLV